MLTKINAFLLSKEQGEITQRQYDAIVSAVKTKAFIDARKMLQGMSSVVIKPSLNLPAYVGRDCMNEFHRFLCANHRNQEYRRQIQPQLADDVIEVMSLNVGIL